MTGKTVFERALSLCGLRGAGNALPSDLGDLESRALDVLNLLLAENAPLSRRLDCKEEAVQTLQDMEEPILFCDELCGVLSFGLGALLIAEEDPSLSAMLDARYRAGRQALLADGKSRVHPIREVF